MGMIKPTRHERISATRKINDLLDNYCNAGCEYSQTIKPSATCRSCPVTIKLQEYGKELRTDKVIGKVKPDPIPWTPEETDYLFASYGKIPVRKIAEKLNRSETAIYSRYHKEKALVRG